MSQYVDGNLRGFIADEAIAQHLRVKHDSEGRVTVAGLTDRDIGTALESASNDGSVIEVLRYNHGDTAAT